MGSQADSEYDYIVCGGGTAGCVLASRLAEEAEISVLVLEAGLSKEQVPASAIPAAVAQILGTEADWQIWSEPCQQLNDRKLHLGRGKFVGGTSGCNGTLCIRGSPQDYDDWGIKGWSGEDMHRYMSKAESFRNKPWFEANTKAHGHHGHLITAPHDNAPISDLVMQSFRSKGLSYQPDMFTTGTVAHGCGHAPRTIYEGVRTTAADFLYGKNQKDNVTVQTQSYVSSIIFEETGKKPKARGVNVAHFIEGKWLHTSVRARKEVILSTGTYCSPTVLMRSGIGPKHELNKHGIDCIVDLPGVGQNLQDHLVMLMFYEVNKPGLTNDYQVWHTGGREKSIAQWKKDRTGFMSQFPFGSFAYARLDTSLSDSEVWQKAKRIDGRDPMGLTPDQPHIEFWNTECYSPKYLFRDFPGDDKHAFAIAVSLFSPQSKGHVTISSKDPTSKPIVDHNYLSNPLDMLVFSEGCRLANDIVTKGAGTKDVVSGSWPIQSTHHEFVKREEWESLIRKSADTCYHPAGTCKMGSENDPLAVVDSYLRVRGVDGLRVVDASVMPRLMGGHPQMAVYGIAEKAADMIKGTA